MTPQLQEYCKKLEATFSLIPEARKEKLQALAQYIKDRLTQGKTPQVTVICTHNSRRSHIGQICLALGAAYYDFPLDTYSGGTEATAFNPSAVAALKGIGLAIKLETAGSNPRYAIKWEAEMPPYPAFSKRYEESPNPTESFGAILVCSEADQGCPVVFGCDFRLALPFNDPKAFDGTDQEAAAYAEACDLIGRELLYAASLVYSTKNSSPFK